MNIKKDTEKMLKILVIVALILIVGYAIMKIATKEVGLGVVTGFVTATGVMGGAKTGVTIKLYEQLEGKALNATALVVGLKKKVDVSSISENDDGSFTITTSNDLSGIKAGQIVRLTAVKLQ